MSLKEWAGLRVSQPLAEDDGFNLLRIGHPKSLNIKYWEVGNEVFGNGYYADDPNGGHEEDLHAPYAASAKDSDKIPRLMARRSQRSRRP
jgi:alpha-L-arabinofuranosidase